MPTILDQFLEIQLELELEDDSLDHAAHREFEIKYKQVSVKIITLLNKLTSLRNIQIKSEKSSSNNSNKSRSINLPPISLPTFDGDYHHWQSFNDLFTALVINNQELSDIQRLHYLQSCLRGEDKELINNIPLTESNFQVAYKLLQERHHNLKALTAIYVNNLLTLQDTSKDSVTDLRKLLNTFHCNYFPMKNLNLSVQLEMHY